ncbi:MAG: hypothetical protein K1X28_08950 [Parachlamydiales bacterium]|nr:hypothetical protein [Parachlamydiales bacterium]
MRYTLIPVLSVLSACIGGGGEQLLVQGPNAKKQRQKISNLQKKLEVASKEKEKAETEVERLQREIDEAKLALIRRQVDDYESRKDKRSALFMEEREALYRLIQSGDSAKAFEAQVELDRILRIITELSDEDKNLYVE